MAEEIVKGLEGVVAGETSICKIDGRRSRLLYRGYSIEDLAQKSSFEEVVYLLLNGRLPSGKELEKFRKGFGKARGLPPGVWKFLKAVPKGADAMNVLQAALALDNIYHGGGEEAKEIALGFIAAASTIVANFVRQQSGRPFVRPDPKLSHAEDFLRMLNGRQPPREHAEAFDTSLILYAEHEFNASTFAARIAASTLSDMPAALIAAIGVLKGPLHGGANADAADLLLKIGSPEKAEPFITRMLKEGKKIPGFGHRVYKVKDPRARLYEKIAAKLDPSLYSVAKAVEGIVTRELVEKAGKPVYANVDFFSGIGFRAMGIPVTAFPAIFAMARLSGWAAHVLEQWQDNRLIRPLAKYIGPEERKYPE